MQANTLFVRFSNLLEEVVVGQGWRVLVVATPPGSPDQVVVLRGTIPTAILLVLRAHELGHNLGLRHSSGEIGGSFVEYGDYQSMMGFGVLYDGAPVSYIPSARHQLGFLSEIAGEFIEWTADRSSPVLLSSMSMEGGEHVADALAVNFPCDECVPQTSGYSDVGGSLWIYFRGEQSS